MGRMVARYVAPEMAALWLIDLLVASGVVYGILTLLGAFGPVGAGTAAGLAPGVVPGLSSGLAKRVALLCGTIGTIAVLIGLYRPEVCLDRRRLSLHAALVALLAFPVALVIGHAFDEGLTRIYALWYAKVLVIWLLCVLTTRSVLNVALLRGLLVRRLVVVGAAAGSMRVGALLRTRRGQLFELTGTLDAAEATASPGLTAQALRAGRVWGLVLAGNASPLPADAAERLLDCKLRGVRVFDQQKFCEQHLGRIDLDRATIEWFLLADGFGTGRIGAAVKRLADLAASLMLLLLTLPLALIVAIAVKLDSPGPVLYRQERVGLRGRTFTLLKFRSMRNDAEAGGRPRWAVQGDPRVTRVGVFMRSTRIDELPQLINVLRGDMSLVGPRPERPLFVERLTEVIPFYDLRASVKPGITGWAQINYPYGASIEDAREKLAFDLYYIKNRSLLLDLLILFSTVRVVLFREGAR